MPGHPMDGKQTWIGLGSELLTYMNRTSEGVLAGIEALVADPLSPVDCKVGNPWIRLVLVCPGDVQFDKDLGHWRPGRWLGHHVMFLRPFLMWPGALSFWGATTIRGWLIQVMWHPHNMPGPKVLKNDQCYSLNVGCFCVWTRKGLPRTSHQTMKNSPRLEVCEHGAV